MKFRNPVIEGFYPDPSICRAGEDYYLVTSTFEYFPGVPVFHSRDLINWRQIGHCLTRPSQLQLDGALNARGGVWAPTIRYHHGRFYMVTMNFSTRRNFLIHTDDPAGEWSEPIDLDQPGIDASLLFDDDGQVYLTTAPALQSTVNIETGEILCEPKTVWQGTGGSHMEAPHLYRIDGMYYMMVAEGGTGRGHMVTIARADNPWGPFDPCPHNPILTNAGRTDTIVQATGHGDLVQDQRGRWWMVFLAIRENADTDFRFHHLGRETFLAPVQWTDGWPVVNQTGKVELDVEGDCLPLHPWPDEARRDDFDKTEPAMCWNFVRNPREEDWSLTDRPGWLRLNASAVTLADGGSPAFVGRRQRHFDCRASALMEFDPQADGEEAGLAVRMDENRHYLLAVTRLDGARHVIVRARHNGETIELAREPIGAGPIMLQILADRNRYEFSYGLAGSETKAVAEGWTRDVSTETGGGFTGVYLGMYATGNGKSSSTPAWFDWFEYVPLAPA